MKINSPLKSIFTLLILLTFTFSFADEWDADDYKQGKLYEGYVISLSGDTTHGYIKALRYYGSSNETTNQTMCYFYENEEDTEPFMTYKPATLKGYKIGDKLYHSIPYSGGLISKFNNFCLVRSEGAISTFSYFWYDDGSSGDPNAKAGIKESNLLRKGEDKVLGVSSFAFGFKKKGAELVKEHKELAKKIANKEKGYKTFNLDAIIEEYNTFIASQ